MNTHWNLKHSVATAAMLALLGFTGTFAGMAIAQESDKNLEEVIVTESPIERYHGGRSTGAMPLEVIERQLAHAERNKIRAAYHRSEYLEERQKMMDWWGACIESMENEQKVVLFRRQPA